MPLALLDLQGGVVTEFCSCPHSATRRLVEPRHLVIDVSEDDATGTGLRLTLPVPVVDEIHPRRLARLGNIDRVMLLVCRKCFSGSLGSELVRRDMSPVLTPAADVGDLDTAMALSHVTESRACFDRLELFGVADQHDLAPHLSASAITRSSWRVQIIPASSTTRMDLSVSSSRPCPH